MRPTEGSRGAPIALWWVSWEQLPDPAHGLDSRPVKWPPPEEVLAFWESGYAQDGSFTTVVGLVRAPTADHAKRVVTEAWTPGVDEWRFVDKYDRQGPPGDRFPAPKWSIEMGRWPW